MVPIDVSRPQQRMCLVAKWGRPAAKLGWGRKGLSDADGTWPKSWTDVIARPCTKLPPRRTNDDINETACSLSPRRRETKRTSG